MPKPDVPKLLQFNARFAPIADIGSCVRLPENDIPGRSHEDRIHRRVGSRGNLVDLRDEVLDAGAIL